MQKNDSLQGEPYISEQNRNSTGRPSSPKNISGDKSGIWIQLVDNKLFNKWWIII